MPTYKTPDVYVEEIPVFPPSVAEVGTAIPAFVGYTERARKNAENDLRMVPTKIYSLAEYESLFGGPRPDAIPVTVVTDATQSSGFKVTVGPFVPPPAGPPPPTPPPPVALIPAPPPKFLLYWAVKLYFDNGGAQCYIVSTGDYSADSEAGDDTKGLLGGLAKVRLEDEPTLLVAPDAVKLDFAGYQKVAQAMLKQCGDLRDRFSILDVYGGDKKLDEEIDVGGGTKKKIVEANRGAWDKNLKYGAAYYPFLKTSLNDSVASDNSNVKVTVNADAAEDLNKFEDPSAVKPRTNIFNLVRAALKDHFITMPPSGAVAGVYAFVDTARGVWKAPANVALSTVLEPVVKIDSLKQEGLNVDPDTGKSINAIRAFSGKGTLVWGARTLLGNDNEWRYINVRRFFNLVEESSKKSTYWAVFEPNDANLWVKVRGMIENYLIDKWREGALAGATPKDAFFVKCGLGTTMTPQDILEGRLNVEIGMAVVRPAEFIVLKFSHKLQTS